MLQPPGSACPARIVLLATLAMAVLLLGLAWLMQRAQAQHQQDLADQRDAYLLHQLRTNVESLLNAGFALEQLPGLQDRMEREQALFANVVAIDVFHPDGHVLYSTDLAARDNPVPPPWRQLLDQPTPWSLALPGQRQVGQRFGSDAGQAAGGIVLTLSTHTSAPTLAQWQARGQHALQWLAVALLGLGVTALALWLGLHRLGYPYRRAAALLHAPLPPPSPAGDTHPSAQNLTPAPTDARDAAHTWLALAQQVRGQWQQGHQRCHQAQAQLQALDHAD